MFVECHTQLIVAEGVFTEALQLDLTDAPLDRVPGTRAPSTEGLDAEAGTTFPRGTEHRDFELQGGGIKVPALPLSCGPAQFRPLSHHSHPERAFQTG